MSATQPRRIVGLGVALVGGWLLVSAGCSPSASNNTPVRTGGKTGSGGAAAGSGGATSTGGATSSTGGSTGSGGSLGTGGAETGGATASGGAVGTGGDGSGAGSSGSGGDTGTGGADTGTGGMGGMGFMIACGVSQAAQAGKVVAIDPVISDFTYVDGTTDVKAGNFSFGNFYDSFSGYSFHYPDRGPVSTGGAGGAGGMGGGSTATGGRGGAGGGGLGPIGITEDLTGSDWHISGVVGDYSAFVVSLSCITDASAFAGIQFTISGTAGTPNRLTLQAAFSGDETGSRVTPLMGMCEGACAAPATTVNLTPTKTLVQIPWSMFTGGRPMATVNPAQLTALRWIFNWNPTARPYAVDLRIDDLRFMAAPGTTSDAGTD